MGRLDNKEKIRHVFLEFEKYDKLHQEFLLEFENGIYNFIADNLDQYNLYEGFSDDLNTFSVSLINCAYEVLEKDNNYPEYRMEMELENMDHLFLRYPSPAGNESFTQKFTQMAKAKMPKYFPALYQLSASGFRLLERCSTYRINSFLLYFYPKI